MPWSCLSARLDGAEERLIIPAAMSAAGSSLFTSLSIRWATISVVCD